MDAGAKIVSKTSILYKMKLLHSDTDKKVLRKLVASIYIKKISYFLP